MLGGSSLDVPWRLPQAESTAEQSSPQLGYSLEARLATGSDDQSKYCSRLAAAVVDAVQLLSNLKVLELTFFPGPTVVAIAQEISSLQVRHGFVLQLQCRIASSRYITPMDVSNICQGKILAVKPPSSK